ncbi:hypothetical protein SDC9_209554 [bioreactor metagenome]|uniref:Uncharacterized protein n=1 Tax=bioreactor metagenome TaxID=1076179 RepID=A0A645JFE3_9ZZZZ
MHLGQRFFAVPFHLRQTADFHLGQVQRPTYVFKNQFKALRCRSRYGNDDRGERRETHVQIYVRAVDAEFRNSSVFFPVVFSLKDRFDRSRYFSQCDSNTSSREGLPGIKRNSKFTCRRD